MKFSTSLSNHSKRELSSGGLVSFKRIVIFFVFSLALGFPLASAFQKTKQEKSPATAQEVVSPEKIAAEKFMLEASAVISKDEEGRIIALQFPENIGLRDAGWAHLGNLTDLQDLDLSAIHVSNGRLKIVGGLKELRSLNLFGNPIDSVSLTYLTDLDKLETLYLYRTFIDDEGIKSIAKMKSLRRLNMFDTFLSDKGLDGLGTCKGLRYLSIGNSKAGNFPESFFSKAGIDRLRANLPDTNIIYFGENNQQVALPKLEVKSKLTTEQKKLASTVVAPSIPDAPNLAKRKFGSDWASFLGPTADGKSNETGLNTNWNSKPPKLLWHHKIGTGFAAPSIANGRLMLYHRVRNKTGEHRFSERLSCLHSETGDTIWEVDFPTDYEDLNGYGNGPRSTPIIEGSRVYILSPEGMLRCLQTVDGKLVWESDLKEEYDCDLVTYGVGASPVVFKNSLLIIAGGKSKGASDLGTGIISIDKRTGVFRYGFGKSPASYATPVLLNIHGRPMCLAFTRDGLLGFHPETAVVDFEFPWRSRIGGSVNAATPVVVGDQVFVSEAYTSGGAMIQIRKDVRSPIWADAKTRRAKSIAAHWATPIYHEGMLYGCSGRHTVDGKLKCIQWNTGRTVWEKKMPDRTSIMFVDGHFINLGENGLLTVFKATPRGYVESGRLDKSNTKVMPKYPAWVAPVIARGLLYVRGKEEIICYDLK